MRSSAATRQQGALMPLRISFPVMRAETSCSVSPGLISRQVSSMAFAQSAPSLRARSISSGSREYRSRSSSAARFSVPKAPVSLQTRFPDSVFSMDSALFAYQGYSTISKSRSFSSSSWVRARSFAAANIYPFPPIYARSTEP